MEQIKMRTIGCGWNQFKIQWTRKGKPVMARELLDHLIEKIFPYEENENTVVPSLPVALKPSRSDIPGMLGTAATNTLTMQCIVEDREQLIKDKALEGVHCRPDLEKLFQQTIAPTINHRLINKYITFQMKARDENNKLIKKQCTGKIIEIKRNFSNMVKVQWNDGARESYVKLEKNKFNTKHFEGWTINHETKFI